MKYLVLILTALAATVTLQACQSDKSEKTCPVKIGDTWVGGKCKPGEG
jgi:hypothetical protein